MYSFIQALKSKIDQGLPGDEAHLNLAPSKRLSARTILASKENYRPSAVGILLFPKNNRVYSLLIQRPTYDGAHSGQVSFPGGKVENTDADLEYTARRECFEEVNFQLNQGEMIGALSPVYIPVSNFMIQPFIFFSEKEPVFTLDQREVEHLIYFDVLSLLNDDLQKTGKVELTKGVNQINVPYFDIESKVVWGATAMILSELKELLKD